MSRGALERELGFP